MNMAAVYALCGLWVVGVIALLRHQGILLRFGEELGFIDCTNDHRTQTDRRNALSGWLSRGLDTP